MKTKLLLISVLFYFTAFSQVNILYNVPNTSIYSYGGIEKINNDKFVLSRKGGDVSIIDENGNVLFETNLLTAIANYKAFATKDTNLFALTYFYSDTLENYSTLTCYSQSLDTIWSKDYYIDTLQNSPSCILNTNDNGFLIGGTIRNINFNNDLFLLKLDSNGNQQWYKKYIDTSVSNGVFKIVQTQDNGYIILGEKNISTYNSYLTLNRVDSVGNEIWDWDIIHNYSFLYYSDLIKTSDNNYIVVSNEDNPNDDYDFYTSKLIKFDIDKNIIVEKYFPEEAQWLTTDYNHNLYNHFSYFSGIAQKENGNFVVISNYQPVTTYNTLFYFSPILYELDTNFNILKRREYRPIPSFYYTFSLFDLCINNDGGVAMIGNANLITPQYSPGNQIWFVNTDTNYCDGFGSCDTIFRAELNYPDSVNKNDTVNISVEIFSNNYIEYNFTLTYYYKENNELHEFTKDTLLNVLPNDIHQIPISYNILSNNNLNYITDSIYMKYDIIPTDSSSHINKSSFPRDNHFIFYSDSSIYVSEISKLKSMISIYPNPNNGIIQLTINDKKLTGSKVEIIDTKGKIIKTFVIKELHTTINLTNEKKGIYFIKIINNNNVETKKIIIQ